MYNLSLLTNLEEKFMKIKSTIFFSFCLINLKVLLNANSPFQNLENFETTIKQAEYIYLDPEKEQISFEEKLQILKQLYWYIDQYKNYFHEDLSAIASATAEVSKIEDKDFLREQNTYYLLTKEVIRKLEAHLKKMGWKEIDHFSRIAKPITYVTTASIGLLTLFKLLEKFGGLPNKPYKYIKNTILVAAPVTTAFWIACNYKDEFEKTVTTTS